MVLRGAFVMDEVYACAIRAGRGWLIANTSSKLWAQWLADVDDDVVIKALDLCYQGGWTRFSDTYMREFGAQDVDISGT